MKIDPSKPICLPLGQTNDLRAAAFSPLPLGGALSLNLQLGTETPAAASLSPASAIPSPGPAPDDGEEEGGPS